MKRFSVLFLLAALVLCGCRAAVIPEETTVPAVSTLPETTTEANTETTAPVFKETETTQAPTLEIPTETQWAPPPALGADEFARIVDYIPTALERLAYATEENFTGVVIYDFTEAYLRYGTVEKLMLVAQKLEPLGYGIVIWDAYRPVYGQQRLWDACPNPVYVSVPGTGTQAHCRGSAVDLTLYDLKTGFLLEMPTDFDDFSSYADRDYRDVSEEAAANAQLLEKIMTECGFRLYSAEWWHYYDTDTYPIEYSFDPGKDHT